MNVAPLQPVLYLWRPYSSQPSQHVCSLPAYSGGHLWGNPQASHSALLQTVWKVCYKLRFFYYLFILQYDTLVALSLRKHWQIQVAKETWIYITFPSFTQVFTASSHLGAMCPGIQGIAGSLPEKNQELYDQSKCDFY